MLGYFGVRFFSLYNADKDVFMWDEFFMELLINVGYYSDGGMENNSDNSKYALGI